MAVNAPAATLPSCPQGRFGRVPLFEGDEEECGEDIAEDDEDEEEEEGDEEEEGEEEALRSAHR